MDNTIPYDDMMELAVKAAAHHGVTIAKEQITQVLNTWLDLVTEQRQIKQLEALYNAPSKEQI